MKAYISYYPYFPWAINITSSECGRGGAMKKAVAELFQALLKLKLVLRMVSHVQMECKIGLI